MNAPLPSRRRRLNPDVRIGRHLKWCRDIQFGRVRTARSGITVATVVERLLAGETAETIRNDYGMSEAELRAAVEFMWRCMQREHDRLRAGHPDKRPRGVEDRTK